MRDEVREEIDDEIYIVRQMPGLEALKVQTKLIKILGSSATGLLSQQSFDLKDTTALMTALTPLLDNFDDELVNQFVESLFKKGVFIEKIDKQGTKYNDKVTLDTHFVGAPLKIWKVVAFILRANFSTQD